jgi:hypothetical protein
LKVENGMSGSLFISMDANFGLVHKASAGKSLEPPKHGDRFFLDDEKVKSHLASNSDHVRENQVKKAYIYSKYKLLCIMLLNSINFKIIEQTVQIIYRVISISVFNHIIYAMP